MPSDSELIRQIAGGDKRALETLYTRDDHLAGLAWALFRTKQRAKNFKPPNEACQKLGSGGNTTGEYPVIRGSGERATRFLTRGLITSCT